MAIFAPLVYLLAVVAVVMMWRGLWGLLDLYLWPENPKRSNLVSFIVGFVLICVLLFLLFQSLRYALENKLKGVFGRKRV